MPSRHTLSVNGLNSMKQFLHKTKTKSHSFFKIKWTAFMEVLFYDLPLMKIFAHRQIGTQAGT